MTAPDVDALAELARIEAERHPARSPQRRAAGVLWVALITTDSIAAARRALPGFAAPGTVAAATELLGRLAGTNPTEGTAP